MKKLLIAIFISFILLGAVLIYHFNNNKIDINAFYNKYVITNKEASLYTLNNNKYEPVGIASKDVSFELDGISGKYFKIANTSYYISHLDVSKVDSITKDNRYKKYVLFNENIVTNNITNFYNDNGLVYRINKSFNLPIIIKDTDKYYVEYLGELLYVKKEDVKEFVETNNTTTKVRTNVRTLAYHFVYKEGEECTNSYICHPESQFISHMKYLSDNNYFTLTMKELELFLDNKIRIPENSIVVTLDDGYFGMNAVKILEQYKINATYFIITKNVNPSDLKSDYVELASHTNDMHNNYKCPGGNQGGQILCEDEEKIIADLTLSRSKLNNTEYFCYPFYDYNDYAIGILKKIGFKMAFIGAGSTLGMSDSKTDKYKIPRLTLSSLTTMDEFIEVVTE